MHRYWHLKCTTQTLLCFTAAPSPGIAVGPGHRSRALGEGGQRRLSLGQALLLHTAQGRQELGVSQALPGMGDSSVWRMHCLIEVLEYCPLRELLAKQSSILKFQN